MFEKKGKHFSFNWSYLFVCCYNYVVDFPYSAVLPILFAGILSQAHLSFFLYLIYIGIFLLFYLMDEIIVF
jgi:hypothetical protein